MTESPAVLVVGPSWVGDMVLAQSLFKLLKQRDPAAPIDVLAPGWSEPLLSRMPEVRDSVTMPIGHGEVMLRQRYRLGRRLRERNYGQAIVLPNSFKSALVPLWARIPRRTGYRGEMRWGVLNDVHRLDKDRLYMTVERFAALALEEGAELPRPLPRPELVIEKTGVDAALQDQGLERPRQPVLALCPGAEYGPAKRWPAEYFAQVARIRMQHGWSVWVFGSANDAEVAEQVCVQAGQGCVNLAGRTSLAQAIDLLSLATVVVSNDSGLMHVGAAVGAPLVAIYGSSDPKFTPPMSSRARILSLGLECSPCFERECPLEHLRCLRDIKPKSVEAAVLELVY